MATIKAPLNLLFYGKYLLCGLLLGEFLQGVIALYLFADNFLAANYIYLALLRLGAFFSLYFLLFYVCLEDVLEPLFRLVRHERYDVMLVIFFGGALSLKVGLLGQEFYQKLIEFFSERVVVLAFLAAMAVVLVAGLVVIIRHASSVLKQDAGWLLSDEPIVNESKDLLGIADQARRFADKIYNGGSPQSLVFGLDAPWGVGKTSFINVMRAYWDEKALSTEFSKKIVTVAFEPLKFGGDESLNDRFIEETLQAISREFPIPELTSVLGGYSRYLKGISSISVLGIRMNLALRDEGMKERLESLLLSQNIKLIVVIDDLDRISIADAQQILYSMKSAFDLPNVSYIVCYDSQNIQNQMSNARLTSSSTRSGNLIEFLEKIVQLKVPIFHEKESLVTYFRALMTEAIYDRSTSDFRFLQKVENVLRVTLGEAFDRGYSYYFDYLGLPDKGYNYGKVIRDPRKIKRFVNHLSFLEVPDQDTIDETDFVHLLLLYVVYPSVFRHLYDVEVNTSSGYFTGLATRDENAREAAKALFDGYSCDLDDGAKFLLAEIFERENYPEGLEEGDIQKIAAKYSGNIEHYLNAITKQRAIQGADSHKFHLAIVDDFLNNLASFGDIFKKLGFKKVAEGVIVSFWQNLSQRLATHRSSLSQEKADEIISNLISSIQHQSDVEIAELNLGGRSSLVFSLLKTLDTVGWDFSSGNFNDNTTENLKLLADRVLGRNRYQDQSVMEKLFSEKTGVLGLHDLLIFRLYLCPDRSSSFFNILKALLTVDDLERDTNGVNWTIEGMRTLSQDVYSGFHNIYVEQGRSLFLEIDELSLDDLTVGRAAEVEEKFGNEGAVAIELGQKTTLKAFITDQLGNARIDSGIGCGYFNRSGTKDLQGIKSDFNKYLFGVQFNPDTHSTAFRHFLEHLLIQSLSQIHTNAEKRKLDPKKYLEIFREDQLRKFVSQHIQGLMRELKSLVDAGAFVVFNNRENVSDPEIIEFANYSVEVEEFLGGFGEKA